VRVLWTEAQHLDSLSYLGKEQVKRKSFKIIFFPTSVNNSSTFSPFFVGREKSKTNKQPTLVL
jgi:hypothetical protein